MMLAKAKKYEQVRTHEPRAAVTIGETVINRGARHRRRRGGAARLRPVTVGSKTNCRKPGQRACTKAAAQHWRNNGRGAHGRAFFCFQRPIAARSLSAPRALLRRRGDESRVLSRPRRGPGGACGRETVPPAPWRARSAPLPARRVAAPASRLSLTRARRDKHLRRELRVARDALFRGRVARKLDEVAGSTMEATGAMLTPPPAPPSTAPPGLAARAAGAARARALLAVGASTAPASVAPAASRIATASRIAVPAVMTSSTTSARRPRAARRRARALAVVLRPCGCTRTARRAARAAGGRERARPRAGCPCRRPNSTSNTSVPRASAASIARAYPPAIAASAPPVANFPALKKYGETRPLLSVNSPNCSALFAIAHRMKASW